MKENEKPSIRVFSFHSVKGGVGKSSLSLASSIFAGEFKKESTLLVDGDLTGTSLLDCFPQQSRATDPLQFDDFLFASPDRYLKIIRLPKLTFQPIPEVNNVDFFPGHTDLKSVKLAVPFLAQEWHLNFLEERLNDLVEWALKVGYKNIIFDFPPGLFGLSLAGVKMQLNFLKNSQKASRGVFPVPIFVSSSESVDFIALFRMLSDLILEIISEREQESETTGNFFKCISFFLRIAFNKFRFSKKAGKGDPAIALGKEIIPKLEEWAYSPNQEERCRNDNIINQRRDKLRRILVKSFDRKTKEASFSPLNQVDDFSLERIIPEMKRMLNIFEDNPNFFEQTFDPKKTVDQWNSWGANLLRLLKKVPNEIQ